MRYDATSETVAGEHYATVQATRPAPEALALRHASAECERLRGEVAEQRVLLRWFLDGDDHTHEDDCGARGSHDLDVCRAAPCLDDCEGPHCACGATEMRARALAALEAP